ncbi:transcriptional adapter 1 isoform X3 [Chrysemys picta bellii]|uniref:transcriptional adapter 1 isoform X3 n=1 Tax=Chrysemys picta bellii TaxID=8478 RepID=UPI0032B2FCA2
MISSWLFSLDAKSWFLHQRVLGLCRGRVVLQPNLENPKERKSFLRFGRSLIIFIRIKRKAETKFLDTLNDCLLEQLVQESTRGEATLDLVLSGAQDLVQEHRFQPQNPLSGAQQFVAKDPQEDDDLKLCSHTMMLPTRGQLEGRMIVTAYEHGLDNVTEEAVTAIVYAVQNHLKDILASVVSRRKAYRLRDGHFKYAFGSNVNPQPYLKNSVVAYNNLIECPPTCVAPSAGQNLASHPAPDDAEQQAALLLACSGNTLPATLPPVNMYDLFEALQVHREVVPAHTVYALNIERIIMKLWHPNHEELQQDKIHRQRLAAKEGLLLC